MYTVILPIHTSEVASKRNCCDINQLPQNAARAAQHDPYTPITHPNRVYTPSQSVSPPRQTPQPDNSAPPMSLNTTHSLAPSSRP